MKKLKLITISIVVFLLGYYGICAIYSDANRETFQSNLGAFTMLFMTAMIVMSVVIIETNMIIKYIYLSRRKIREAKPYLKQPKK